jgi:hypothetical protein
VLPILLLLAVVVVALDPVVAVVQVALSKILSIYLSV